MNAAVVWKRCRMPLAVVLGSFGWFALRRLTEGHVERATLHEYVGLATLVALIVSAARRKIRRPAA
jgi:hypothetical protein